MAVSVMSGFLLRSNLTVPCADYVKINIIVIKLFIRFNKDCVYFIRLRKEVIIMIEATKLFWTHVFDFRTRSTRSDFWWAVLGNIILAIIVSIIARVIFGGNANDSAVYSIIYGIIGFIYMVANISIVVRRLHDINRSGGWWWIQLIPVVGGIILFVFELTATVETGNRFPKMER